MIKVFNSTVLSLILYCIISCDSKQQIDSTQDGRDIDDTVNRCAQIGSYDFIDRDFKKYYHSYLDPQDSCFLRTFIHFYRDSIKEKSYRSFKNCYISSVRDYKLYFNFSIVKRHDSDDYFFYGLYDVHDLAFSTKYQLGSLVPFKNDALNDLINFLLKDRLPGMPHRRRQLLELYLTNLYYTIYDDMDDAPIPIFDRSLSLEKFIDKYKNKYNASMIETLFTEEVRDNLFIFEINYVGAIIFKVDFNQDGLIKIEEFIAPKIDRVKSFRSDGLPDYLNICR